jgi:hypothetical protein
MPSITTLPANPVADRAFKVTAAASAGGNVVRIWCTAAPPGSRLRGELDSSKASRVAVQTVEVGRSLDLTLDAGGAYQLLLEEIQRGSGFTGGYQYDRRGAPSEEIVASVEASLYIASEIVCQLGYGADLVTLRLFGSDTQIVATSFAQHGVATPMLVVGDQTTARARAAAESEEVREAVAALTGSATTALGSPDAVIRDLIERFETHRDRSASHTTTDEANTVPSESYASLSSLASQREALSKLRDALGRHVRNVDPASGSPATGSATYHTGVGWTGVPIEQISPSGDPLSVMVAAADTWRAYEAHRTSSTHRSSDRTNRAAALPPLLNLHRLFIAQLAQTTPDPPPTGHAATTLLASAAGFRDA